LQLNLQTLEVVSNRFTIHSVSNQDSCLLSGIAA
jgi:hypothetical protein